MSHPYHVPATAPHETVDRQVAIKVAAVTGKTPTLTRRLGAPVYGFPAEVATDGKSLDRLYGEAPLPAWAAGAVLTAARRQFDAVEARFLSEEHRRQRQGANAGEAPAYSKAELQRLSPADLTAEQVSIGEAMAERRVAGFVYAPEPPKKDFAFTKSELKAMHPSEVKARWDEIAPALESGKIDYSR